MQVLEHYDKVDRWETTTYYPKFQSPVSRITVHESGLYVDYSIPKDGNNPRHNLSEFEAVMNDIYTQRTENQTYRKEEI